MKLKDLATSILALWNAGKCATPIALLGPPGVGKTSIAVQAGEMIRESAQKRIEAGATEFKHYVVAVKDLTSCMPEDIAGLPRTEKASTLFALDGKEIAVTDYAPQRWLAAFCQPGAYGVLVLDDLPAASPAVQIAVRQLLLDRRVGEYELSPHIFIVVTGNRREDKSGATPLPNHLINSVVLLGVDVSLDDWRAWYEAQGLPPVVSTFMTYRPALLNQAAEAKGAQAFPTPRSWTKLAQLWQYIPQDTDCDERRAFAEGLVGPGAAVEFMAFVNLRASMVAAHLVLENPRKHLPEPGVIMSQADKAYALISGLLEEAFAWQADPRHVRHEHALARVLRVVSWCVTDGGQRGPRVDYAMVAHRAIVNRWGTATYINARKASSLQDPSALNELIEYRDLCASVDRVVTDSLALRRA